MQDQARCYFHLLSLAFTNTLQGIERSQEVFLSSITVAVGNFAVEEEEWLLAYVAKV